MDHFQNQMSVTEAVRDFAELINRVYYRRESYMLTKGGKSVACLSPAVGGSDSTLKDLRLLINRQPILTFQEKRSFQKDVLSGKKMLKKVKGDPWAI